MKTALGFRVHSGWAAMAVVTGSPLAANLLDRRRIEICDSRTPGSKQPYHYAAELDLPNARAHIERCAEQSRNMAREAMESAIARFKPAVCAIGIGSGRPGGALETILRSHAAIHTAEGEFFREAIKHAAESCRIPCLKFREKELIATGERVFAIPDLAAELTAMRKMVGSPWTQDEKFAALAAWLAMKHRL